LIPLLAEVFGGGAAISIDIQGDSTARTITLMLFSFIPQGVYRILSCGLQGLVAYRNQRDHEREQASQEKQTDLQIDTIREIL
jgi:hypothetical protein